MTIGADRRGIPIPDGVKTAVAAARVGVSSASRSAFRRKLAQKFTPPPIFKPAVRGSRSADRGRRAFPLPLHPERAGRR